MNEIESNVWSSFVLVVHNFHGNNKAEKYIEFLENTVSNFIGGNMSKKFTTFVTQRFAEYLGNFSEEPDERFYQDMYLRSRKFHFLS